MPDNGENSPVGRPAPRPQIPVPTPMWRHGTYPRRPAELSPADCPVTVEAMTAPSEPPAAPAGPPDEQGLLLPDGTTVAAPADRTDRPAERPGYSPLAVIARVPVRRITRVQAIALVVFSLIALGPVLALVVVLRSDTATLPIVVSEPVIAAEDGLILTMTVTSVNAVTREMGVRMAIRSSSTGPRGLIEGGKMTETVNLGLPAEGSIQGSSTISLEKGATVGAVEFVVPLRDGSIARYPYDTYASDIVVIASREGDGELGPDSSTGTATGTTTDGSRVAVPISVVVAADVPGFVIDGTIPPDQPASTRTVDLDIRRNGPTLVYTTWIMVLWWALSVSAVLLVWAVAIWRSSPPPWAYGYLVGVLFALAPLRGALPGQPPAGVLVDYVSFYWAVGTMGVGLLILVSFFLRDARHDGRTRSRAEEEHQDRVGDVAYDTGEVPVVPAAAPVAPLPVALGTEPVIEPAGDREGAAHPPSSPSTASSSSSSSPASTAREPF